MTRMVAYRHKNEAPIGISIPTDRITVRMDSANCREKKGKQWRDCPDRTLIYVVETL